MLSNLGPLVVLVVGSVGLLLAFVAVWLTNFSETAQYTRAGLAVAAVVVVLDLLLLGFFGTGALEDSLPKIAILETLVGLRSYVFTVVGLLFAHRLNEHFAELRAAHQQNHPQTAYGMSVPSGIAVGYALLATVLMIAFSSALFVLTHAEIGSAFREDGMQFGEVSAAAVAIVAVAAFGEEITFRLGLQNGLTYLLRATRFAHPIAVVATAAFWSIAHIGALEPGWVKMTQVFVFGLLLGQLNRRFGVVPCIIMHVLFNVVFILMTPWVLETGA